MTTSNASFMSIELPTGQDDDFFKTSMNANRIFAMPYDDMPIPTLKATPTTQPRSQGKLFENVKPAAWSTATSELTETAETQQQHEIARLTEKQAQATQATLKANQIIDAQRAEIEELKAQRIADNANRATETLATKAAQTSQ
jgi:hypothetical protein